MMYLFLKYVHIISATVLFGTGLGSAFYMYRAYLVKDIKAIQFTTKNVVLADWIFTTPAIVIQLLTGLFMVYLVGFSLLSQWIMISLILFVLVGVCWIPVVWIQIKLKKMVEVAVENQTDLPPRYHRLMKVWFWLGWPAFISVMIIIGLMVFKP